MSDVLYQRIAQLKPNEASQLCNEYGYNCQDVEEGAEVLEAIANDGDEGFKKVMALHPEKDVLIALFASEQNLPPRRYRNFSGDEGGCGCSSCSGCTGRRIDLNDMFIQTNKASGGTSATTTAAPDSSLIVSMQSNTIMMVGILALAAVGIYIANSSKK
jgi:hypothetical protein